MMVPIYFPLNFCGLQESGSFASSQWDQESRSGLEVSVNTLFPLDLGTACVACVILDEDAERERALTILCVAKCSKMDLTNHRTAWNALKNLQQPHRDNLKRMGYCVHTISTGKRSTISRERSLKTTARKE